MKHTIIIPEGVKPNVSIFDGIVTIEYEEPITGFVTVKDNEGGVHLLYVNEPIVYGECFEFIFGIKKGESLHINGLFRPHCSPYSVKAMSNEDKWLLLSELKKKGFMLDEEKGLVVKWEPKDGERYYIPNISVDLCSMYTNNCGSFDSSCIERGIAYPTAELAIERAKRMLNTEL